MARIQSNIPRDTEFNKLFITFQLDKQTLSNFSGAVYETKLSHSSNKKAWSPKLLQRGKRQQFKSITTLGFCCTIRFDGAFAQLTLYSLSHFFQILSPLSPRRLMSVPHKESLTRSVLDILFDTLFLILSFMGYNLCRYYTLKKVLT